jgi:hypothetical protein
LFCGECHGGNQIIILEIIQNGKPYSKNGRRFPIFPGFLLSMMTPKTIEKNAEIKILNESPIEAKAASKLIV